MCVEIEMPRIKRKKTQCLNLRAGETETQGYIKELYKAQQSFHHIYSE